MSLFGCNNRSNCTAIAIVVSLIVGIITAFLRITAVITLTPAFLWVTLGVAVVYIAGLLLTAALYGRQVFCESLCTPLTASLSGAVGTVLFSIVLLAIEFVATSVIGAIIAGALLFFFSLTVTAAACLVSSLAKCSS